MNTINLTTNEIEILKACLTYDNRRLQLQDNPSDMGAEDIAEHLGWTMNQAGGVMSSLQKKDMLFIDKWNYDEPLVFLTRAGIDAIFDIIEGK